MHQLWIFAGPNGSGKSSLVRLYLAGRVPVINPDDIARDLNPSRPEAPETALRAGREALNRQKAYLADHRSFALETTFSGNREIALMKAAKAEGFKVNLVYVCTDSPKVSIARIRSRVATGGHHVPSSDVARRYERSLTNLPEGVAVADRAYLLDNTRTRMRLVASIERNQVKGMSNNLPKWLRGVKLPAIKQAQGLSL